MKTRPWPPPRQVPWLPPRQVVPWPPPPLRQASLGTGATTRSAIARRDDEITLRMLLLSISGISGRRRPASGRNVVKISNAIAARPARRRYSDSSEASVQVGEGAAVVPVAIVAAA